MKIPPHIRVYGDINWRGTCPTEAAEQSTFFNQLRKQYPETYGAVALHIKNEGKRSFQQMAKQKAEGGFISGASDIVIPSGQSFICEMKRQDHTKSKWQSGQIEYMTTCQDLGAFVCVAFGWEAAWEAFEEWRGQQT